MTAVTWWPQDVNQQELEGSYREYPDTNRATFQPEVGPPKVRRRMSIATDRLTFSAHYSSAEYASLLSFFRTSLKDGTLPFARTRRRTGATDVFMFEDALQLSDFGTFTGDLWTVAVALRSLPNYPAGVQVVGGKDAFTKLLLHLNSNTGITDTIGNAVAASGNAQISTALYRFGGASLLLDGTGDFLTITNVAALRPGASDFTLEFWVYLAANQTSKAIIGTKTGANATEFMVSIGSTQNCINVATGAGALLTDTANPLSIQTWHHVAWARSGSNNKVFIDGAQIGTTFTNSQNFSATSNIIIGHDASAGLGDLNGSLDEAALSIGIARWTAAFTPGTEAYS